MLFLIICLKNQLTFHSNSPLPELAWILMFYFRLTSCRSNHTEGLKVSQWVPQKRNPLSLPRSISPSSLTDVEALKCNLANAFFTEWSMFVGKTIDWKISCLRSVLSPQFATDPSCAYASCQSEKVQMLLVPGGLVNRLHRLSPSCYTFCRHLHLYGSLFAPVVDLLDATSPVRGTKLWHVTLISLTVLDAVYLFSALLVKIFQHFHFLHCL